ncbi:hypothetical protein N7520_005569 [Penicillium odoratum]|uniref:uncharacterized protein n=1 Tax=Penicillium odoratum TaxID=1167516 RepID=UPI00254830EA|nr:uncharacterized protein N7520_005569 [Penicillium odoratum]KAJ5758413.1 hypothetical protein N7520_005569 [Penicillium odoratum]
MTVNEAWEIQKILASLEFPSTFVKSLKFSLFRAYGIPTISGLLSRTGQSANPETYLKRYVDTTCLLQEFMIFGPTTGRACSAIARMNWVHEGYRASGKILEDDMLFTLGLFATQPIIFIDRYEWRGLTDMEKCAIAVFWKSIGDGLKISYDVLPSGKTGFRDGLHWFEELMAWSEDYEVKNMVPHITNHKTALQTTGVRLYMLPKPVQHIGLKFIAFLMDERLRQAMMYDACPAMYAMVFSLFINVRKFFLRYLVLPRPYFLRYNTCSEEQTEKDRIYVTDWDAAPYYVKPTLWNRWGPAALYTRALGRAVPGTDGTKYYPQGYFIPDVGPKYFEGKGRPQMGKMVEELKIARSSGCPFA